MGTLVTLVALLLLWRLCVVAGPNVPPDVERKDAQVCYFTADGSPIANKPVDDAC
jgi:hypothetical protein